MNFYEIQKTKSGTESALHKKSDIRTSNGDKVTDDDAISTKYDIDDGINIVFNYDYNCTPRKCQYSAINLGFAPFYL